MSTQEKEIDGPTGRSGTPGPTGMPITRSVTLRNITTSPQRVHTLKGARTVNPSEVVTDEFAEGEAKSIEVNAAVFATGDNVAGLRASGGAGGGTGMLDNTALRAERDGLRKNLMDIAALFGSDVSADQVKGKVEELLAKLKTEEGEDATDAALTDAIAKLDDAKPEHWTQQGKPSIETLETLTGKKVTRAQVEALPTDKQRVRKTS